MRTQNELGTHAHTMFRGVNPELAKVLGGLLGMKVRSSVLVFSACLCSVLSVCDRVCSVLLCSRLCLIALDCAGFCPANSMWPLDFCGVRSHPSRRIHIFAFFLPMIRWLTTLFGMLRM